MNKPGLMSVEEARSRILAAVPLLESERVPLQRSAGRVLSEDVIARLSHPPAPVSAMDGYALRAADAKILPVRVRQIGASRAGARFDGVLEPGSCVRIFTGGVVPEGADTIALQEDAADDGNAVVIAEVARPGQYIRKAGLDFAAGQVCLPAGSTLTARAIGIAASCGHSEVAVRRRPRIAILSTGDELTEIGRTPGPDQIVASNGIALSATVQAWGGEPLDLGIAPDRIEAIADAADLAQGCDMLVTTGGASVGEHDLVHAALSQRGFVSDFWRIAMRPGKPLMFGHVGRLPVLGMPGNPVSALVCAVLFLRPAMAAMTGSAAVEPPFQKARLGKAMPENDVREDYVRATLEIGADGHAVVHPFSRQDSSMLLTLASADALIRRRPFAAPASAGEEVDIVCLASNGFAC